VLSQKTTILSVRPLGAEALATGPLVLLAEDDEDLRFLLTDVLENDGYRVRPVGGGQALWRHMECALQGQDTPAIVISDQKMPGLLGLQVLGRVRKRGWQRPLVLITAFGSDQLEAEARAEGVRLLAKPFDLQDFRTLVRLLAPWEEQAARFRCVICGKTDQLVWMEGVVEALLCPSCRGLLVSGSSSAVPGLP